MISYIEYLHVMKFRQLKKLQLLPTKDNLVWLSYNSIVAHIQIISTMLHDLEDFMFGLKIIALVGYNMRKCSDQCKVYLCIV